MESHKSHVPNQQPVVIYPIIPVYPNLSPWYPDISWSHLRQPRRPRIFHWSGRAPWKPHGHISQWRSAHLREGDTLSRSCKRRIDHLLTNIFETWINFRVPQYVAFFQGKWIYSSVNEMVLQWANGLVWFLVHGWNPFWIALFFYLDGQLMPNYTHI